MVGNTKVTLERPETRITAVGNAGQTIYTVTASGVGYENAVTKLEFAVWSSQGGQDDLRWYTASRVGAQWVAQIPVAEHLGTGIFLVHAYCKLNSGDEKFLGWTSFYISDSQKIEEWDPNIAMETILVPGLNRSYEFMFITDSHIMRADESDTAEVRALEQQRRAGFVNSLGITSTDQFPKYIDYANQYGVDAVLLGGDIVDYPSQNNINLLKGYLAKLNCPYLYVLGNHDWNYPWENMTAVAEEQYRPLFSDFIKNGTLEANYLEYDELIILAVDNSTGQINPQALPVVKDVLTRGKPVIILMHVPLQTDSLLSEVIGLWGEEHWY